MEEQKELQPKVEKSFELIGKKWTGLIIYVLMSGPKRFSELNEAIPALSRRLLTERVKELEEHDIVLRTVIPDRPIRTEYTLTQKGKELGQILGPITQWAESWIKD
ncbi:winged helix-turn-helix transcriptional regulator [Priestia flexa]|uniref:winged helix-turn-helix transcriptional regulator n=1 Tax=Priestia TaxID=2800373 RepID=UPI002201327B|nr:helix-turn-helix domain-containing protein [Priestia flexa]MDT2044938.1 helix-turn-helix domain-containing protein [Priestia flexa]USY54982.1 helix-turn-helix transcriptional regulator [Bacillus sp. 1780r2a1]